jgi:hypothetical protein
MVYVLCTDCTTHFYYIITKLSSAHINAISASIFCSLDRAFFNYEENNQQNALIISLINLLISNYSNMFRPLSWGHHQGVQSLSVTSLL